MGEESQLPESMEARPRFQIVDLFAIIAAVAAGFGLARALGDTPNVAEAVIASSIFAAVLLHPIAVAAQFARKRRRRPIGWKDVTGMVPCAAVLTLVLAVSAESLDLLLGLLYVMVLLLSGNAFVAFALLASDRPKSSWYWTDWYACALATLIGFGGILAVTMG